MRGYHRADLLAGGGDLSVARFARSPALSEPIGGQPRFTVGGADVDVAAKTDDVMKTQTFQKPEQLDIAKAAVRQDRDDHALGQQRFQMGQAGDASIQRNMSPLK